MRSRWPLLLLSALLCALLCVLGTTTPATATTTATDGPSDTSRDTTTEPTGGTVVETAGPGTTTERRRVGRGVGRGGAPRAYFVDAPTGTTTPLPVVLGLHGYGGDAAQFERYWELRRQVQRRGFLYVRAQGLVDDTGRRAWNASAACCGRGRRVDDARFLRAVIQDVRARYDVDDDRIYVLGKSNGGFMAHTLACRSADLVAAIVSFAGAGPPRARSCRPSEPVSVLQLHGTADPVVAYGGGRVHQYPQRHPGAVATVDGWARRDRCTRTRSAPRVRDLDRAVPGKETSVTVHHRCARGTEAVLWRMARVRHNPAPTRALRSGALRFLLTHPKR